MGPLLFELVVFVHLVQKVNPPILLQSPDVEPDKLATRNQSTAESANQRLPDWAIADEFRESGEHADPRARIWSHRNPPKLNPTYAESHGDFSRLGVKMNEPMPDLYIDPRLPTPDPG